MSGIVSEIKAEELGKTELMQAIEKGDNDNALRIIDRGWKADIKSKDLFGKTPLMYAAAAGNVMLTAALIAQKAEVDAQDVQGETAMFYATRKGSFDCMNELYAAGASIEIKSNLPELVEQVARYYNDKETFEEIRTKFRGAQSDKFFGYRKAERENIEL